MSGKRGSNSRPIAWKAIALPTELLPLVHRSLGVGGFLLTFAKATVNTVGRTGFEPVKT